MAHSAVVLETDPKVAQYLAAGLRPHFTSVHVVGSRDEMRKNVSDGRAEVLVLDIEDGNLTDVEVLHRDFPKLTIVCTHRVPDEDLWMAALEAGASDVCPADDVNIVLASVLRHVEHAQAAA
jgi:DNA-binding response OmpR family regulator